MHTERLGEERVRISHCFHRRNGYVLGMSSHALSYLEERFAADAEALRERASSVGAGKAAGGPDAKTSLQMADACEVVIGLVATIPSSSDNISERLRELIETLNSLATKNSSVPAVKAVYAGAATRVMHVIDADQKAAKVSGSNIEGGSNQ